MSQSYRLITHMFYGVLPPEGWRFTADGEPPGQWHAVLKMQWVEGFAFNHFVKDNLARYKSPRDVFFLVPPVINDGPLE